MKINSLKKHGYLIPKKLLRIHLKIGHSHINMKSHMNLGSRLLKRNKFKDKLPTGHNKNYETFSHKLRTIFFLCKIIYSNSEINLFYINSTSCLFKVFMLLRRYRKVWTFIRQTKTTNSYTQLELEKSLLNWETHTVSLGFYRFSKELVWYR